MEHYEPLSTEIAKLLPLVASIYKDSDDVNKFGELAEILASLNPNTVQSHLDIILTVINSALNKCNKTNRNGKKQKYQITAVLKIVFSKVKVGSLKIFYFSCNFLLGETYDRHQCCVARIDEEYKLLIVECMNSLIKALSWDTCKDLYVRENVLLLSQIFHIANKLAKDEKFRKLRLAAIECIMNLAKVDDVADITDIEFRYQVAEVLMFFVPGIISGLTAIALEDEKTGHKVIAMAIKVWGRIIALHTQNYNVIDDLDNITETEQPPKIVGSPCTNESEFKKLLENTKLNSTWYKNTDSKLSVITKTIAKLTCNFHPKVRRELMLSCILLRKLCSKTIPLTTTKVIEILIILSEDVDDEIAKSSGLELSTFSNSLSLNSSKVILENLEENFFSAVTALPRIFNGLDVQEQLSALNLLIGYIRLFGTNTLAQIFHSHVHLKRLLQTLIHISELEKSNISLSDEHLIQDLEIIFDKRTPWKVFHYFCDENIQIKLETICATLGQYNVIDMVTDLLVDIFINSEENRKEATLLLNNVIFGLKGSPNISSDMHIITHILNTYLYPEYWNVPVLVSQDCLVSQIENNIIQICLQVEGISKIALVLQNDFKKFLLKTLYPILDRAGSRHPLIKEAGMKALKDISMACGYPNITKLVNSYSDYFTFHITCKISKLEENERVLNVLTTVMKCSDIDVLPSISDILSGVLLQTYDKFFQEPNANVYLELFQIFIKCLMRWLSINVVIEPIKSKHQKEAEHEDFKVTNSAVSDDEEEITEGSELPNSFEKDKPPIHVQLTVQLLQKSLNFLPSKDRSNKILALDILRNGLEIIRDWENDLLPLVHLIWNPLRVRFKEKDDFLIINLSFQLLITLARLSKDFIRSRTIKDVLPELMSILKDTAKKSYLQDKGSAYRYSQAYKMQLSVLQQLAKVIIDLDMPDDHINSTMKVVMLYLSNKQPVPLQKTALTFYGDLAKFDQILVQVGLEKLLKDEETKNNSEYKHNIVTLLNRSEC